MSRLIDRIIAKSKDDRRSVVVQEWDQEVWYTPITTQDRIDVEVQLKARFGEDGWNNHQYGVLMLISKCEDQAGSRLFSVDDFTPIVQKAEAGVLDKLMRLMLGLRAGEAGKGSAKTPEVSATG